MEKMKLNNELTITYPDGFHVMDQEELGKHQYFGEAPGWSISDPDRHIMISAAWKKTNGIVAKLLNTKDIARQMEAGIKAPMQQYGYQFEEFLSLQAGGKGVSMGRNIFQNRNVEGITKAISAIVGPKAASALVGSISAHKIAVEATDKSKMAIRAGGISVSKGGSVGVGASVAVIVSNNVVV